MLSRFFTALLSGAALGLAMLGIEELANLATAQPALALSELTQLLPCYLGWPAIMALCAVSVRDNGGRVLALTAAVWAFVIGAVAALLMRERGLPAPAVIGFLTAGLVALGATAILLRLVQSARIRWALAVWALVFLPAWRAVNLNAFGPPFEPAALRADALIMGISLVLAGLAAGLAPHLNRSIWALAASTLPALLAILGRVLLSPAPPRPAAASDQPDLVLVVIDTLRADHLGCYGYSRPTSPALDDLAAHGLRYTDATSAAPWTLPSFASLSTGLIPAHHGAGVNSGQHSTQAPLDASQPTLAARLSQAGYRTGAIVSNPYLKASFGLDRGFDSYDDALGLAHMMMLLHPVDQLPLRFMPDRTYRVAPRMVAAATRWWQETAGGPRFLMLHLMDPHKPYNAPQADYEAVAQGQGSATGPGSWQDPVEETYDAEIHYADRSLQPFLRRVLDDGATVVFTADHGEEFGDHPGAYPQEHWPADVRHGHTLYHELLHVPLIVAGPDLPVGTIDRPVRNFDIMPTLLALAGARPAAHDGQPLTELLGQPAPPPAPRQAQALRYGTEKRAVIGTNSLKLISTQQGEELYDLTQDPAEQHNLAEQRADELPALRAILPGKSQGESTDIDPALLEQLRAVGYVDE